MKSLYKLIQLVTILVVRSWIGLASLRFIFEKREIAVPPFPTRRYLLPVGGLVKTGMTDYDISFDHGNFNIKLRFTLDKKTKDEPSRPPVQLALYLTMNWMLLPSLLFAVALTEMDKMAAAWTLFATLRDAPWSRMRASTAAALLSLKLFFVSFQHYVGMTTEPNDSGGGETPMAVVHPAARHGE